MNISKPLDILIDGSGSAFAIDHRSAKRVYIQDQLGNEIDLRYQALRKIIPIMYGNEFAENLSAFKALKSLEYAKSIFFVIYPKALEFDVNWLSDINMYEELVRTTLNWQVFTIQYSGEKIPNGDDFLFHIIGELEIDLQKTQSETKSSYINKFKDALDVISPNQKDILAIEELASKAYASKDYVQKKNATFIEYYAKNPINKILKNAFEFHRKAINGIQLFDQIDNAITSHKPFSFIRVGEGEGCFLSYEKYLANRNGSHEVFGLVAKDIYRIWFDCNIHDVDISKIRLFKNYFWQALHDADVIGVPSPYRVIFEYAHFLLDMKKHGFSRGYVGISEILESLLTELYGGNLNQASFTDCDIARPLYEWQNWSEALAESLPRLLFGRTGVTLVTCHSQLAPALERFLGIKKVRILLIPPERARVHGENFMSGDHFEDHFERINSEIKQDPGDIVIVAAGFLGKAYCATAKSASSVSIDIGSLADYWAGVNTRVKNSWSIAGPFI